MDRDRIEPIVRDVVARSPRKVVAAWLFGSVARGTERPDSDVDVALLLADPPRGTMDDIPADIESELTIRTGRRAQVVVADRAPPELAMSILSEGRLLVDDDPARRVSWEVHAMTEYWDFQPLLALCRLARGERA